MLLAVILLMGCAVLPAAAAVSNYTVTVSDGTEGTATVSAGDSVTIRITVMGDAFNGLQGTFRYDSALFELKSIYGAAAADDPKTAEIELYLLSDAALVDGAEVATAVFAAKSAGTGTFSIASITVGDYEGFRTGDAVPAETVGDKVTVKSGSGEGGGSQTGESENADSGIVVTPLGSGFRGSTRGNYLSDGSIEITVLDEEGNTLQGVSKGVRVMIPNVQDGQVVAVLDENGNIIDLVRKSLVEDHTAYALLPGSARIRIINNAKYFQDVKETDWFNDYVIFVSSHELFIGVSEDLFAPQTNLTRAMMVTVLWRLENRPQAEMISTFIDLKRNSWYDQAVDWAAEKGVALGYSSEAFGPQDDVTREQMAAFLFRYMGAVGFDVSAWADFAGYADGNEVSAWAEEAMHWAVGSGLIIGRSDTELAPRDTATRAEVATMFKRLVTMMVKPKQ